MQGNGKYLFLLVFSLAGLALVAYNQVEEIHGHVPPTFCIIKNVTNLPCPACGTTRSVIALSKGEIVEAVHWNPLGFVAAIAMLLIPCWFLYDLLRKKQSLANMYVMSEVYLKNKKVYLPLIILLIINWVWNIQKGL
jgi:hypothetical protein